MSVKISKLSHNTYSVNNKEVIEDFDGRIYSRVELTLSEEYALLKFIKSLNEQKSL